MANNKTLDNLIDRQSEYKDEVLSLLNSSHLEIDLSTETKVKQPTSANSMFLINKEQGDWAEKIICNAINEHSERYCAIRYGTQENLAAGDPGFEEYFENYIIELNAIGKKPDLLLFNKKDIDVSSDLTDDDLIRKAIAAIEVRSSSYLANKYNLYMEDKIKKAECQIKNIIKELLTKHHNSLLEKQPTLFKLLKTATPDMFRELDFRLPNWRSSANLKELSEVLRQLKTQIKVLQKRDYLSITPKLEDFSLVNRWIQHFGVRHYYLQVFFDKAYILSFLGILKLINESKNEGRYFFVESDTKNQNKTTVKVDIKVGRELLKRIDMPEHQSAMKELDRGRLLYYVTFHGGHGYMDVDAFRDEFLYES